MRFVVLTLETAMSSGLPRGLPRGLQIAFCLDCQHWGVAAWGHLCDRKNPRRSNWNLTLEQLIAELADKAVSRG